MTPAQTALLHRLADAAPGLLRDPDAVTDLDTLAGLRLCTPVGDGWRITTDGEAAVDRRRWYRVSWPDREPVQLGIDNAAALALATRGTITLDEDHP